MFPISIARHGRVALAAPKLPTRAEFIAYVEAYERASVSTIDPPPADLARYVREATSVFISDSLRSRDSLRVLAPERTPIIDAVFREEPQAVPDIIGRWPVLVWFALGRGVDSFHPGKRDARLAMRRRADAAADRLILAARQGPVALIGHGWFNRAISRSLLQSGWDRVETRGGSGSLGRVSSVWGAALFRRRADH